MSEQLQKDQKKSWFKNLKASFVKTRSSVYIFLKTQLLRGVSDKTFVYIDYLLMQRKFLNLKSPDTFSEKMQWIKVYGGLEACTNVVDKYEVRKYIEKRLGDKNLVPLIGVWDSPTDIDFEKLPNQFVLKSTHGSQQVYVCRDKSKLNKKEIVRMLDKWLKENFYLKTREIQYRDCKPRIICEAYLEDTSGGLVDYKFYCFNGKPHMILTVNDRFTDSKGNYFFLDLNWKIMDYIYKGYEPNASRFPEKPSTLAEMTEIAKVLAKEFPFVRVDLYSVNGKIYFGELTFIPSGGLDPYHPLFAEYALGKLIDLSKYPQKKLS